MPILAYSANNAADSAPAAAYVAANIPSCCRDFLHITPLSVRWVGVATWVPFFDNGTCVVQKLCIAFRIDTLRSGRHNFSSAHFGVRPSSDRRPQSEPTRKLFHPVDILGLMRNAITGGLGALVEGTLPKQAAGRGRSRALPQQVRHPSTQA
jgi:hypothetical protein